MLRNYPVLISFSACKLNSGRLAVDRGQTEIETSNFATVNLQPSTVNSQRSRLVTEVVNKFHLLHDFWADEKRIRISKSHAAVQAIHGKSEGQPEADNDIEMREIVRIGFHFCMQAG